MKLPKKRTVYQFEKAHASVIYSCENDANGKARPKLEIMVIDQYRYQRELSIALRHEPGNLEKLYWDCHAYRHPGRREYCEISESVAKRMIARILHLSAEYPTLLFNNADERRPRCEGFVHFHEALLDGATPSVKLLG